MSVKMKALARFMMGDLTYEKGRVYEFDDARAKRLQAELLVGPIDPTNEEAGKPVEGAEEKDQTRKKR